MSLTREALENLIKVYVFLTFCPQNLTVVYTIVPFSDYYLLLRARVPAVLVQAKNYAIYKGNAGKLDKSTWFFYMLPQESYRSIQYLPKSRLLSDFPYLGATCAHGDDTE